ncbi:uncharacterized protein LOC118749772 [Rhagoletis pomonella]|uniref:uncharacterized protein LOC118749772 n=1 Tax=Rhagoletis pomonella TaxID=28610 RepID=UPI0017860331|nr:uncharacterized protein LOC118749772 [Rhagoletis pomonella]
MDSSGNPSAMKEYANQEAVRTFILGLNSKYTSGTLYSHNPKDLETAYAIASTIYHDNVNSQFDVPQYSQYRQYNTSQYQNPSRRYHEEPQMYRPNVKVQNNHTAPRQQHQPLDVDPSQQYTRSANYNRNHSAPQQNSYDRQMQGLPPNNPFRGDPQKRERNRSSRNFNIQQKVQRVNQTRDEELKSLAPDYENDEYETGSAFLGA